MTVRSVMLAVLVTLAVTMSRARAAEPGWAGQVVARGEMRQQLDATDILERPYRPFHFYGNTVRREYYRGTPAPLPRDMVSGASALLRRR